MGLKEERKIINFIVLIRAIAVLLVVWDHIGPFWAEGSNIEWIPGIIIYKLINKPLGIIQYFGFLGVALFFITSGFIITYVAQHETRIEFIIKRIFRIYPPLIFSFVTIYCIDFVYTIINKTGTYWSQFSLQQYISEMTLMNYIIGQSSLINGVTWSLIIEVIYYLICFVMYRYIKKSPRIALGGIILFCYSSTFMNSVFGINLFGFLAKSISYLPYLIYGQIIYYLWAKRISIKDFIFFTLINYYIMVKNTIIFNYEYYSEGNSYGVSFMYAYLIFIIAVILNDKIRIGKYVRFIADTSYSLYLNHSTIGGFILTVIYSKLGLGFTVAFLCAVISSLIVAFISYKYIEKPSMKFIKRIIKI